MTLFSGPLNDITLDDVRAFCGKGLKESFVLDYKSAFPTGEGLERTICAFANTYGGLILIGVDENDESKPKLPVNGIAWEPKLEDRIWNIIVDNIYPPIFPDIHVCPQLNDRTVILIRVPQSNETPHAINDSRSVYVRTGNRNKPEDIASLDRIEWLYRRRRKSEELKEGFYGVAHEHFLNLQGGNIIQGETTISFSPFYPSLPLLDTESIFDVARSVEVLGGALGGITFPTISSRKPRYVADGICQYENYSGIAFMEMTRYGTVYYKRQLAQDDGRGKWHLLLDNLFNLIGISFKAIDNYYQKIEFGGIIELRLAINNILGVSIERLSFNNVAVLAGYDVINQTDKKLVFSFVVRATELSDISQREIRLAAILSNVSWALGYSYPDNEIMRWLNENKGSYS